MTMRSFAGQPFRAAILRAGLKACAAVLLASSAAAQTPALTLKEAEQRAVDAHPLIRAVQFSAQAAGETVREMRSAYFPTAVGAFTGAGAIDGTRITAGALNNPTILSRFAGGLAVSQLLTDFGRTPQLVESASLSADSRSRDVDARRADVLLQVDRAYFNALRAQAVLTVAQQTVDARQVVAEQTAALAQSNLKSSLDVSFARVNLGEAQLLLVQARNDVDAAFAALASAMGQPSTGSGQGLPAYQLSDEAMPAAPPDDSAGLVAQALKARPDIAAQRLAAQSAQAFTTAEKNLRMPSLSAVGALGFTPYHDVGLTDRYLAAGVTMTIPIANGSLFAARYADANFRAQALEQVTRDLENSVARDVTVAWLDARTAYQRLELTAQLLAQAADALDLAQARYNLGLGSIVELTQAQLNKTTAEIGQATARYDYQTRAIALRYQTGDLR
jgi:outer membrane protein